MDKLSLYPLDSAVANVLAERRGITVSDLMSSLIRKEAALELVQGPPAQNKTHQPAMALAGARA